MYQVLQAFKLDVHCTLTFIMCKICDIKLLGDCGKILGGCWAKLLGGCIPLNPPPRDLQPSKDETKVLQEFS